MPSASRHTSRYYPSEHSQPRDYRRGHRSSDYEYYRPAASAGDRHEYTPTYGTYLWSQTSSRRDPSDCPCDCCPHSYAGARRAAQNTPTTPAIPTTPCNSGYSNIHERLRPCSPNIHHSRSQSRPGHGSSRDRRFFTLDVYNDTNGSLRRQYGRQFSLAISNDMVAEDIVSRLAPDSHRYKVVVHWDDGVKEPLDARISLRELRRHANYLEVKKIKKVRFA